MSHGITDVVRRHGDEEHPRQRAPGVLQAANPHEEAEGETQDGDEGGAVEGGALGERHCSLGETTEETFQEKLDTKYDELVDSYLKPLTFSSFFTKV